MSYKILQLITTLRTCSESSYVKILTQKNAYTGVIKKVTSYLAAFAFHRHMLYLVHLHHHAAIVKQTKKNYSNIWKSINNISQA